MQFNAKALIVFVAFVAALVLAQQGHTIGAVAIAAGLIVEVTLWAGVFGLPRGSDHRA